MKKSSTTTKGLCITLAVTTLFASACSSNAPAPIPVETTTAEAESVETANGTYATGIFTGTGKGFGGDISVELITTTDRISEIKIIGEKETENIGKAAIPQLEEQIKSAQSAAIDGVAGATITSNAVKEATQKALNSAMGLEETTMSTDNNMKDGTYTTTVPSFFFTALAKEGHMTADVTIKDNQITGIKCHDYSDTPAIGGLAFDMLAEKVIEHQSLAVDAISGATVSSNAFLSAMDDTLSQAGANLDALKNKTIEKRAAETVNETTQVAIVGAGMAGLTAAIQAANNGLEIILVEKQDVLGSSTTRSEGYVMAAGTEFQKENGVTDDTTDKFYEDIFSIYQTDSNLDAGLLKFATGNSDNLIDFLEDNGVVFDGLVTVDPNGARATKRVHCAEGKGGGLSSALFASLESLGTEIKMGTTVDKLLIDENGSVTGIHATNAFGDDITINADAVILCAGSYAGDKDVFEDINPAANAEALFGYGNGDGYYLAKSAGAQMINLDYPQLQYNFYSPNMKEAPSKKPGSATLPVANVLLLNATGKRVINEDAFCFEYASKVWEDGQPDNGWCLYGSAFDSEYPDVAKIGLETTTVTSNLPMAYQADDIRTLANMAGIDPDVLEETLNHYNEMCEAGNDSDFGKDSQYMQKIEGTYTLLRLPQVVTDGYSGAKINEKGQVLAESGDVIKGLYAAGSDAVAQMSNANYFGCGTSLLIAGVYGRSAADSIAEELTK